MTNIKKVLMAPLLIVCTLLVLNSCTKEDSATKLPSEDELLAGEVVEKQPSPGVYTITKFIDTGDDETAQFNGYTFEFKANGTLIATNNGQTYTGSWDLNNAETVMTINIAGTNALDDLDDDDWEVIRITNQRIKISAPGPVKVIFTKI